MKNISTGTGLCVAGLCAVIYPVVDRLVPAINAVHAAAPTPAANAAVGPAEPTIVWYGVGQGYEPYNVVFRAWSNGRVEATSGQVYSAFGQCAWTPQPACGWLTVSDPNQGYSSAADVNFDEVVDGADLGTLLAMWGPAPRHDIPPSACPLNLITP
jgi:hypothetical protein